MSDKSQERQIQGAPKMGSLTPIFEGLLLMDYARWKVYFKWIMPPEIAGLAPRTNLIFSPATAGAVTDGCEGIIQPGWQKLAAFRQGQKCLKTISARPVFAIFATTASLLIY